MTKPEDKPLIDELLDDNQQIEVPENDNDPAAPKDIDLDEEDSSDDEFKKLDNKAFAAMRKEAAQAKKERDELKKQIADFEKNKNKPAAAPVQPQPILDPNRRREMIGGVPVPETEAEWDALARKDWRTAIDLRSIISARKVQEESKKIDTHTRVLDESKNKALQTHPELADVNSEKGKIYLNILERNPDYLTMSKGPLYAMRDMEEEMRNLGYTQEQIFNTKKEAAQNDATRVSRAALTSGGRMPVKSARTVTLSKDDMEFCTAQGIDPKDYAREKLELENNKKGAQL